MTGKLLLSLRPEKIRLYRTSPGGPNTFPGRISVEVFKGAVDDLTVVVAGGLELQALLANDGQQEFDFHEGEEVFCRIQPEDINLVSRTVGTLRSAGKISTTAVAIRSSQRQKKLWLEVSGFGCLGMLCAEPGCLASFSAERVDGSEEHGVERLHQQKQREKIT